MTDWLTSNIKTAYPFEDTDAYDDALTAIADANVALIFQDNAFLRAFDTAGSSLLIVNGSGVTLIDSADGTYVVTVFGSYDVIKVRDLVTRNSCELVVKTGEVISVAGLDVPFASTVHDYKAATLYSLNDLDAATTLNLGVDFSVRQDGDNLFIDLADPVDRVSLPATPYIFTINDQEPTGDGSFWFRLASDLACHQIDPRILTHIIELNNICRACCQCADYYGSYIQMQGVDDVVAQAISDASDLMSDYHALISRWSVFINAPNVALPVNTATTARDWAGNANPAKALNVVFRFIEGTYGGTLAAVITNSLDNIDVTALTVTVSLEAGKTFNKSPGIIQRATTKDPANFAGFPGVFVLGALPAFEAIMLGNAVFNNELVGETVIVNLLVEATLDSIVTPTIDMTLTLTVPVNGGMTLTNPTEP